MDLNEQLDHIFHPRTVAVVGASASPEKVGFRVVSNLLEAGFRGRVYPVNPGLAELFGLRAYPSISAIPGEIDLAVIAIPAELTIAAVKECMAKGVKGALIISGGFSEVGTKTGASLQAELRDLASKGGTKILGPNTQGLVNPRLHLTASFQSTLSLLKAGNVAVVTQSGGLCIYIAHALSNHNVGISMAMGLGNRCGLDFEEVITYLAQDDETRVIAIYVEGLEQPKSLMRVAREVVKRKPIVAYKGGRGEGIDRATLSHTGALAGRYELYKAAFAQAGMITADNLTDMIDAIKALAFQPPSLGKRVAIFSVQAGPAIIMADKCHEYGLTLAQFPPALKQRLKQLGSPLNAIDNPVDVGWKSDEFNDCREMLRAVLEEDGVDGIVVGAVFLGSNMGLMRAVIDVAKDYKKPITVCLDSPHGTASAEITALEESGIPTYPLPERAVTGLAALVKYGEIIRGDGGGGIRTHGPSTEGQRFSRPSP